VVEEVRVGSAARIDLLPAVGQRLFVAAQPVHVEVRGLDLAPRAGRDGRHGVPLLLGAQARLPKQRRAAEGAAEVRDSAPRPALVGAGRGGGLGAMPRHAAARAALDEEEEAEEEKDEDSE